MQWMLISLLLVIVLLIQYFTKKKQSITWGETNAQIVECFFSSNTWTNESLLAKGISYRKIKLTLSVSSNGEVTILTRKIWTKTKNRELFAKGNWVTILYDKKNPKYFKLKYDL